MSGEIFGVNTNTPQVTTGNPRTVNDAVAKNPLGTIIRYKGNKFMYVKFDNGSGNVAAVAGGFVHWKTLTPEANPPVFTVTSDQTDAMAGLNSVAGVIGNVVTDLYFTFIQISGIYPNAKVVAAADINDTLCGSATDLVLKEVPGTYDPNLNVYGICLANATTAGVANVLLQNLDW